MVYRDETLDQARTILENKRFLHACQLRDFESYLMMGGIPSRHALGQQNQYVTPFDTDEADLANRVYDKIFLNLHDFGRTFAKSATGLIPPTAYGPILIHLNNNILSQVTDMCVSLRSAGGANFNRENECVPIERLGDLFNNEGYPRFGSQLRETFRGQDFVVGDIKDPEINCSSANGILSFEDSVIKIVVDPYIMPDGSTLKSKVESLIELSGRDFRVYERDYLGGRKEWYAGLMDIAKSGPPFKNIKDIMDENGVLADFASGIASGGLEYQYIRYLKYLRAGTLGL